MFDFGRIIVQILTALSLSFFHLVLSCLFFWHIIKKSEPVRTVFYLKYYSILMMPLAVEALIRSMFFVSSIYGSQEENIIFYFLIASILILCFCVFTLNQRFVGPIANYIYIFFVCVLVAMIICFPIKSFMFDAAYQILSVWGCIAIALYALSKYTVLNKDAVIPKKGGYYVLI